MDLKHKDAPPQQTIERIREILKSVGTEPTLRLLKNTDNIYSASLYDTACGWRVNGKGTSEEYCIASAYGEAMERLQAYFIYERSDKNDPAAADDFLMYPDEQKCETSRVKQDYPFIYEDLRTMFAMECGCRTDEVSEKELDEFLSVYFRDTTVTVPYYSVLEQKVVYLPEQMISATCGSNGLAAGNTPAEALNQGISEILERHVKELIYTKGYTPPELSRAFLSEKLPEIAQTIAEIEAMGPYTVVLKDAHTVVVSPEGEVFICAAGNAGMARGGSGDALAGVIGSLLAQNRHRIGVDLTVTEIAAAGVYLHAQAGDLAAEEIGEYGMLPCDLIERLPLVCKELSDSRTVIQTV